MEDKKGILLESGTNELEIVEFHIGENSFGINVAKVKEIIRYTPITKVPLAPKGIKGVIKLREQVMSVVDLPTYLGMSSPEYENDGLFIIAQFNNLTIAFQVHGVDRIHRFSWKEIESPSSGINGGHDSSVTGIVKMTDKLLLILDFEKILADISPETGIQVSDIANLEHRARSEKPILVAEDSKLLTQMILEALTKSGYVNVTTYQNGKEAWDRLQEIRDTKDTTIEKLVSCVITDIEMPQMDGHSLTKAIKTDSILSVLPVIIFSSLINDTMRNKGNEVGANEQISKPEIGRLVSVIDQLIL